MKWFNNFFLSFKAIEKKGVKRIVSHPKWNELTQCCVFYTPFGHWWWCLLCFSWLDFFFQIFRKILRMNNWSYRNFSVIRHCWYEVIPFEMNSVCAFFFHIHILSLILPIIFPCSGHKGNQFKGLCLSLSCCYMTWFHWNYFVIWFRTTLFLVFCCFFLSWKPIHF